MLRKLSRLLPIIAEQRRILGLIAGLTVIYSVLAALQPLPMKLLVDYALQGHPTPVALSSLLRSVGLAADRTTLVAVAALASLLIFAAFSALDVGLTWLWSVAGQRMVNSLSSALFERLQRRSLRYHQTHDVGDALSRLSGDTWCVYQLASQVFSPIEQILTLVSIGVVAWRMNPGLAMLSIGVAPFLALSTIYFGRRLKSRQLSTREAESRILSFVHQTLSAMPVVQAFVTEDKNALRFQSLAADATFSFQRRSLLTSAYGMVGGAVSSLGMALVLFFGGREVLSGTLTVGSLIVFLAYLQRMQKALESLLNNYGTLKPLEASVDRVIEVLDHDESEVRDREGAIRLSPHAVRGSIRFDGVTYGYEASHPVLRNIELDVQPGETIGLVGATGSGKSTLLSLVPRFVDPWSGRLTLDGIDLRTIRVNDLREQIGIVLQDSFLFPMTIAENIGYGRLGASREEIEHAATLANADEFIRSLPLGYETTLGERGSTLSGGERQRISIARALLKNAPILILDEPTAALDATTEMALMSAVYRLMEGRTTFVIAHRLSTIRRSDRILVLDKGEIAEQGTHDSLLEVSALYRRAFALQTGTALSEAAAG